MDPLVATRWLRAWRLVASDPLYALGWVVVLASFVLTPALLHRVPTFCPFQVATGLPCPGCGLSRSFVAAAHLDLASAFSLHLFGPALLAGAIVVLLAKPAGQRLDPWLARLWSAHRAARWATFAIAAAWLAWWGVRVVTAARS